MSTGTGALLFLASMLCFAVGFGFAWIRARRRVQAKIHDRLRQEMEQRMAEEVLRRLRDGKLHEDIEQTLQEQGYASDSSSSAAARQTGETPPSDTRPAAEDDQNADRGNRT